MRSLVKLSLWSMILVMPGSVARAAPEAPVTPEGIDPAWHAALCAGRTPCRITGTLPAGTNPAQQRLVVAQLELSEEGSSKSQGGSCQPHEYWLITLDGTAIAQTQQLLVACADGRPAGASEDKVIVAPNTFTYRLRSGSAWKSVKERVLRLSPVTLVSESSEQSWVPGLHAISSGWSWEDFSGETSWYSPWCHLPDGTGPATQPAAGPGSYRYLPIPLVKTGAELQGGSWTTTSLGSCALTIDSTGKRGFLLQGEPGSAEDASLSAVLVSEADLLLEVRDDHWVRGGRNEPSYDHLQLWLGPKVAFDRCVSPLLMPRQWSIRVSDGKVIPGFGSPPRDRLQVERQEVVVRGGRTVMRLHVVLPLPLGSITVAYSDSDDGKAPERVLATSALVPGLLPTLGAAQVIAPRKAVCEVRKDKLTSRLLPYHAQQMPVLGSP